MASLLSERGYHVYGLYNGFTCPSCKRSFFGKNTPHPVDFFCSKRSSLDKWELGDCFFMEVKTKIKHWPNRFAINLADWYVYQTIARQISFPFWLTIVDQENIYSAKLEVLEAKREVDNVIFPNTQTYAYEENGITHEKQIIFFPFQAMDHIGKVPENYQRKLANAISQQSTTALCGNAA